MFGTQLRLQALADRLAETFAHVGIAVSAGSETAIATSSAPGLSELSPEAPMRVASVSKIIAGQVALEAFGGDVEASLDEALGFRLRPDRHSVTLGQMLSHVSGLTDTGGYQMPPQATLREYLEDAVWTGDPGARFEYCNLGYICLAEAAAHRVGRDFGEMVREWLARRGIEGWLNWAGAPEEAVERAVPIYRLGASGFEAQIDGPPSMIAEGQSVARFSPQGGLRLSLAGALRLAEALPDLDTRPLHLPPTSGDLFDGYGAGLMILRRPTFYPRPLIGHFANAYGLAGGVWHDAEAGLSFAYLLNGLAFGDDDDALRPSERAVFDMVAALV